ncbi:hypothetical protein GH733_011084 [Mirounga leonina]|nr:hypothetical protein GH733_011084 [Mirounga leonina]
MGAGAWHGGGGPEEGRVQASPCPPAAPRLSRIWHTAALASNNSALIRPGGHIREGWCEKVSLTAFRTDTNKFSLESVGLHSPHRAATHLPACISPVSSTVWGHNDFYLEEVQPKSYLILYVINQYNM